MTDRKQILGWTQREQAPPGEYVRCLMVFRNTDGSVTVSVRNEKAEYHEITLSTGDWDRTLGALWAEGLLAR